MRSLRVAGVYLDEGVETPDGSGYSVQAFRPVLPRLLQLMLKRSVDEYWKVRVRQWPRKLRHNAVWATEVWTWTEAAAICNRLQKLIEAGKWRPEDGDPRQVIDFASWERGPDPSRPDWTPESVARARDNHYQPEPDENAPPDSADS
jgi:hypothetical protein